jgi:DNA recombination protein RmuC
MGWLVAKAKTASAIQAEKDAAQHRYTELEKEFVGFKATASQQLQTAQDNLQLKTSEVADLKKKLEAKDGELLKRNGELATAVADLGASRQTVTDKDAAIKTLNEELKATKNELNQNQTSLASTKAAHDALQEKLQTQKEEMAELNKKFNAEFEIIANKILETKTEKFTKQNSENLKTILEPLGKNIDDFKKQVDEVYKAESKERFSLGEKVKELAQLNQVISEEARNLTKALKGEAKTQGRWGEMILEKILEKSGLRKGEEYFMEYQLFDAEGKALRSEVENKKMRPDALIMYPDHRHLIIDSKVSLNAFVRATEAENEEDRNRELQAHLGAITGHIDALSKKAYDDYHKSLDFVMMFIPNESAYIAAMQTDPDLWHYAYEKRVLLISPTNLVAALKLIADLWKREYQNQNAQEIADRGAKLYDKFVGFVDNLGRVGKKIEEASNAYELAKNQLSIGPGNLVQQATELKKLGLKTKKMLPKELSGESESEDIIEEQNQ